MIQLAKKNPNKISYNTLKNNKTLFEYVVFESKAVEKEVEDMKLKIKL